MTGGDQLSGRQVLLVEDEMMVSMMIEDMLADLGCAVIGPVTRLNEAVALATGDGIDIAILDVNLNGEQSFAVADALATRGVPFVFATGYGDEDVPDAYGNFVILNKPFQQGDLEKALTEALQGA